MIPATTAADLQPADDTTLIGRARRGDEAAVRSLVQRHNRRIYRAARAILANDAEAEDVVQDTYVRAFTHLDSYRGEAAFATWLTRIAINEALGRKRRSHPTTDIANVDTEAAGGRLLMFPTSMMPASPDNALAREQVRALLEQIVEQLPEAFRTVFMLREVEDLSAAETSEQLGVPVETVKTRLHRARSLIRTALDQQLGLGFADLFPFDGARCDRVTDRTMERLRTLGIVRA